MKNTTTIFSFFLLILIALISNLPSTTLAQPIFDINGDILQNPSTYYILPTFRGMGGGLELAVTGNETCPMSVVQSRNELSRGLPVKISSPLRIGILTERIRLDLSFTDVVPTCTPTTQLSWTVVMGLPEGQSVKITGYDNTVDGWFTIERASLDYKLVFCPVYSESCSDIGVNIDADGNRLLVPITGGDPFFVQFRKVYSSSHDSA